MGPEVGEQEEESYEVHADEGGFAVERAGPGEFSGLPVASDVMPEADMKVERVRATNATVSGCVASRAISSCQRSTVWRARSASVGGGEHVFSESLIAHLNIFRHFHPRRHLLLCSNDEVIASWGVSLPASQCSGTVPVLNRFY